MALTDIWSCRAAAVETSFDFTTYRAGTVASTWRRFLFVWPTAPGTRSPWAWAARRSSCSSTVISCTGGCSGPGHLTPISLCRSFSFGLDRETPGTFSSRYDLLFLLILPLPLSRALPCARQCVSIFNVQHNIPVVDYRCVLSILRQARQIFDNAITSKNFKSPFFFSFFFFFSFLTRLSTHPRTT